MKKFVAFATAVLFATAGFGQEAATELAPAPASKPKLEAPDSPVVRVGDEMRPFCTGVFLEKSRYVLTAGHCVADELNAHFRVRSTNGLMFDAELALFAASAGGMSDFALLYLTDSIPNGWKGSELGCATVPIGTEVEGVGYPGILGGALVHIWGKITSALFKLPGNQFAQPVYLAQIPLARGDSGGPVFTADGKVVATMIAYNAEQLGLGILQPVKPVCDLLGES